MKGMQLIMNILFVTGEFADSKKNLALGGMAYAVYKSALGMQRRGHNVQILAVSNCNRRWFYRGVEVISVRTYQYLDDDSFGKVLMGILKREYCLRMTIKKLNKKEHIDIIQYTGWFGIGLLHSNVAPSIMRVSSYTKVQFKYNYFESKKYLLEVVEYLAAKKMNYIFAPSKIMAVEMEKDIGRKIGIKETPFLFKEMIWDESLLQKKLKGKKYIFYFGRMSVDKGILVIRDVLYAVLDKYHDIYFVFAGSSSKYNGVSIEKELLRASKQYKKRILFLGWLEKNKLYPVIYNAEMILMPSLSDNFPNSCAEAMSLGKIVIGSDGSSLEQFIENGKNGFLAKIGNAKNLYYYIEKVLELEEGERQKISRRAQMKIKKFDLDVYSTRMEVLYKKIVNYKNVLKK